MRWQKGRAGGLWLPGSFRARAPRALVFGYPPSGGFSAAQASNWWNTKSFGVFPGAEGYGTSTIAGRGAPVIRVTNLNDAGPGSFRAAVQTAGPRTVIFDVSGTITLTSDIIISSLSNRDDPADGTKDFLTVAGQTAPSPGITLRGGGLKVRASDVLIQHLRIRVGDLGLADPGNSNAIQFLSECRRGIMDHCSLSWAVDQNAAIYLGPQNVTFSNTIFSEGLYNSIHPKGAHSMGLLVGGETPKFLTVLRCLFMHNNFRNPYMQGETDAAFVNNMVYDSGSATVSFWDDTDHIGLPGKASLIGNKARAGPSSLGAPTIRFYGGVDGVVAGSQFYLTDNDYPGGINLDGNPGSILVGSPPIALPSPLTIIASSAVEATLSANAGARPLDRDSVDTRLMTELATNGGHLINSQTDVGSWPTLAQNTRVLSLPSDYQTIRASGYSGLEEDVLFPQTAAVQPV